MGGNDVQQSQLFLNHLYTNGCLSQPHRGTRGWPDEGMLPAISSHLQALVDRNQASVYIGCLEKGEAPEPDALLSPPLASLCIGCLEKGWDPGASCLVVTALSMTEKVLCDTRCQDAIDIWASGVLPSQVSKANSSAQSTNWGPCTPAKCIFKCTSKGSQ